MENYDLNKESSYLMYWDFSNLCEWAMSQKLPADGFKWEKKKSGFTEKFIRNYDDDSDSRLEALDQEKRMHYSI